jgi:hypothetical protein
MPRPREFVTAAGLYGGGSVILAIVLFGVSFIEHFRDHNVSSWWFGIIGMISFCAGSYIAYDKERDKYEKEVFKNGKPEIKCHVNRAYVERISLPKGWLQQPVDSLDPYWPEEWKRPCLVILDLDLWNERPVQTTIRPTVELSISTGSTTVIGRFVPGGLVGFQVATSSMPGIWYHASRPSIDVEIVSSKPLTYGAHRPCWAFFFFEDFDAFEYKKAIINLRIQDGAKGDWHTHRQAVDFVRGAVSSNNISGIRIIGESEERRRFEEG